tara:strand:+ start:170 stop:631 length:462 start_codon:yes stop_codon:yes gene_type:complete
MKFKSKMNSIYRKLLLPFFLLAFLLDLNFYKKEVFADSKLKPANADDIALYEGMGVSYLCLASRKEIDLDFDKSLNIATATFVNVIRSKHGSKVIDLVNKKSKEVTVKPEVLGFNGKVRILGKALQVCPDNIPKKSKEDFNNLIKKIESIEKD